MEIFLVIVLRASHTFLPLSAIDMGFNSSSGEDESGEISVEHEPARHSLSLNISPNMGTKRLLWSLILSAVVIPNDCQISLGFIELCAAQMVSLCMATVSFAP